MSGSKCECEEGLPEWIMSYADMITILMAFFVVMYSMAGNKDTAKEQAVLKSLRNQFGPMVSGWGSLLPILMKHHNTSSVDLPYKGGTKSRNKNRGGAEQRRKPEGDYARMHTPWPGEQSRVGGVVYFPENSDVLTPAQEQSLDLAAAELGGKPQKIEIRGHTSRRATRSGATEDPWNLAYARCRAVMQYLVAHGIDPQRIRLGVAGDNEPAVEGGTPSPYVGHGRVEVFMLNEVVDPDVRKQRVRAGEVRKPTGKPHVPSDAGEMQPVNPEAE